MRRANINAVLRMTKAYQDEKWIASTMSWTSPTRWSSGTRKCAVRMLSIRRLITASLCRIHNLITRVFSGENIALLFRSHVRVNLGGSDRTVTKQLLYISNVNILFKQ